MLSPVGRHLPGFVIGALGAVATGAALRRLNGVAANAGAGSGLVAAAAVYPAMRRSLHTPGVGAEALTLAASVGIATIALRSEHPVGRRLLAGSWAAHALFDVLKGASPDSRLPRWYPALCAGYDVALAGFLLRPTAD